MMEFWCWLLLAECGRRGGGGEVEATEADASNLQIQHRWGWMGDQKVEGKRFKRVWPNVGWRTVLPSFAIFSFCWRLYVNTIFCQVFIPNLYFFLLSLCLIPFCIQFILCTVQLEIVVFLSFFITAKVVWTSGGLHASVSSSISSTQTSISVGNSWS